MGLQRGEVGDTGSGRPAEPGCIHCDLRNARYRPVPANMAFAIFLHDHSGKDVVVSDKGSVSARTGLVCCST